MVQTVFLNTGFSKQKIKGEEEHTLVENNLCRKQNQITLKVIQSWGKAYFNYEIFNPFLLPL